jgi:hypothetical protein
MDPLFALLDSAAKEVEEFVTIVAAGVDFLADILIETADDAAEQLIHTLETSLEALEATLQTELEPQLDEWLIQPLLDLVTGVDDAINEVAPSLHQTWQPLMNQHPACVGCQHYHGQVYGDTVLVCGMHPYGWESETCPDHDAIAR